MYREWVNLAMVSTLYVCSKDIITVLYWTVIDCCLFLYMYKCTYCMLDKMSNVNVNPTVILGVEARAARQMVLVECPHSYGSS